MTSVKDAGFDDLRHALIAFGTLADEIAWSFVAEATDATMLRRFARQFPDSPRRAEADRRVTALEAAPTPAPAMDTQAPQARPQSVAQAFQSDGPQIKPRGWWSKAMPIRQFCRQSEGSSPAKAGAEGYAAPAEQAFGR